MINRCRHEPFSRARLAFYSDILFWFSPISSESMGCLQNLLHSVALYWRELGSEPALHIHHAFFSSLVECRFLAFIFGKGRS